MINSSDENEKELEENEGVQVELTEEEAEFAGEIGDTIFESALIRYMAGESPETVEEFETFINLNAKAEDLLEKLYEKYPEFGKILDEEALAMKEEIDSFSDETK
ncbi:MAG: hypothetical protein R3B60_04515 [Candidatus Paceibacterota bacterium]